MAIKPDNYIHGRPEIGDTIHCLALSTFLIKRWKAFVSFGVWGTSWISQAFFWHQYWDDFCTKQMFPVNVNVYKIALNSVIIWTIIALTALWVRIFFGDLSLSMGRKVHVWQIMSLYMYNKQLNQALVEIKLILSWFFPCIYIYNCLVLGFDICIIITIMKFHRWIKDKKSRIWWSRYYFDLK